MKTYFGKAYSTALLSFVLSAQMHAQSTAFTYNGRLNNNGVPVTGAYDMQFSVYDADVGNGLVAGPLPANAVGVTNGLFTARIDFGAGVFTGPPRWLEISVRPAGGGNFTILSPRQELTSSPYSIRSQTAGTAADVSNGAVVKSLNSLRDNINLVAGANVSIAPSGNTLTISSTGPGGSVWSLNGATTYYNAGNVGIGTSTPQLPLQVSRLGPYNCPAVGAVNGNLAFLYLLTDASYHNSLIWDASRDLRFGAENSIGDGSYVERVRFTSAGTVGIGTPSPQAKLHLYDPVNSVSHRIETGGGVNAWTRVSFVNANGQWDIGTSRTFNGDQLYFDRPGIGTVFSLEGNGFAARFQAADLYLGHASRRGSPGRALVDFGDRLVVNFNSDWASTVIGGSVTEVKTLRITGGADLAEPFAIREENIKKGSVVVIDEHNPGHLKLSTQAYDTRVAGVVSGANGIKPGISLHQEGAIEGGENVALSGRVYVQADAGFGAIKPGDLLTTSETPGHAMKVTDHAKAQGAILGKAMSGLKEGKGMVLVLVTLQ